MMTAPPLVEDPTLKGLPLALDAERVAVLLEPVLGERCLVLGIEVIKHKPGKRCALAYSLRAGSTRRRLFAKTFRTERGARIYGTMSRLAQASAGTELTIPRPLAYFPGPKLLVTEFLEGCPLGTTLYAGLGNEPAMRAARALAALHDTDAAFVRTWSVAQEIDNTTTWLTHLPPDAGLDPAVVSDALERLHRLAGDQPDAPQGPVHRDFYLEQLWDMDGATALLDLDDAREGDRALDVGNFLAHLTLRGLQFPSSARACSDARPAFFETYLAQMRSPDPTLRRRVLFYETTTLFRLCGVYANRARWARRLPPLLLETAAASLSRLEAS